MKNQILILAIILVIASSVTHKANKYQKKITETHFKRVSIFPKGSDYTKFIKDFDYYTYCPTQKYEDYDYYRVSAISKIAEVKVDGVIQNQTFLYYCGKAVQAGKKDAECGIVCTYPGPAFDIKRNRTIHVQWINQIRQVAQDVSDPQSVFRSTNCPANITVQKQARCFVQGLPLKPSRRLKHCDPTHLNPKLVQSYKLTKNFVPITTHVHGLEIPPKYDGNPTTWFTRNGTVGVGFHKQDRTALNAVTYIYDNTQIPGTLWYHDHAMHVTKHNVFHGLVGVYLIRDQILQRNLPTGDFQKFLIFARDRGTGVFPKQPTQNTRPNLTKAVGVQNLSKNVFRFRILNALYVQYFSSIYFQLLNVNKTSKLNSTSKIPFTVIGTDSAVAPYPDYNVLEFSLGSAERIDILIDLNLPIVYANDQTTQSYLRIVSVSTVSRSLVVHGQYLIQKRKQQQDIDIQTIINFGIGSSQTLEHQVPKTNRYRHIVSTKNNSGSIVRSINSHPIFMSGKSQNPVIGEIQDWYLINLMTFLHPIHIHLINYRIIANYKLKKSKISNCAFYQLALYQAPDTLQGCKLVQEKVQHEQNSRNLFLENDPKSVPSLWKGCQQFQNDSGYPRNKIYENAKQHKCQFVISPISNYIPTWAKFWKQTAMVAGQTALRLRIRWTRTDYDKQVYGDNFFSYTNQQIASYPGYVYHCHFLHHEDSEMMRPIMVVDPKTTPKCDY